MSASSEGQSLLCELKGEVIYPPSLMSRHNAPVYLNSSNHSTCKPAGDAAAAGYGPWFAKPAPLYYQVVRGAPPSLARLGTLRSTVGSSTEPCMSSGVSSRCLLPEQQHCDPARIFTAEPAGQAPPRRYVAPCGRLYCASFTGRPGVVVAVSLPLALCPAHVLGGHSLRRPVLLAVLAVVEVLLQLLR